MNSSSFRSLVKSLLLIVPMLLTIGCVETDVENPFPEVLRILNVKDTTFRVSGTYELQAEYRDDSGEPANEPTPISWESSNPKVLTIDGNIATGVSEGMVSIYASVQGTSIADTVEINVEPSLEAIKISTSIKNLAVGGSFKFGARYVDASKTAQDINPMWQSSDTMVAVIDTLGLVRAVSVGVTNIIVSFGNASDSVTLSVQGTPEVRITPSKTSLNVGETFSFMAQYFGGDGQPAPDSTLTWISSDSQVLTIDKMGMATAIEQGNVTVTASFGELKDSVEVMVESNAPTVSVTTVPSTLTSLNATAGTVVATIDIGGSATGWTATKTGNFIMLSAMSGNGNGTLTITYVANTNATLRTATVTVSTTGSTEDVATKMLTLTQVAQGAPSLSITTVPPSPLTPLGATEGTITASIDIGGSATGWTATKTGDFIMLSAMSGTGGGILTITYAENTGVARMGTVMISTTGGTGSVARNTLTLTQQAPPPPTVSVTAIAPLGAVAGTVTATIDIGGSATGWTATKTGDFIMLSAISGTSSDRILTITYAENTGASRTATVTVVTTGGTGSADMHTLTLTQQAPPPTVSVTAIAPLGAAAGTVTTTIDIGGSATGWTATKTGDFIMLSTASGTGDGMLTITYAENTGASRTATVTISTTGGMGSAETSLTLTQRAGVTTMERTGTLPGTGGYRISGDFKLSINSNGQLILTIENYVTGGPDPYFYLTHNSANTSGGYADLGRANTSGNIEINVSEAKPSAKLYTYNHLMVWCKMYTTKLEVGPFDN